MDSSQTVARHSFDLNLPITCEATKPISPKTKQIHLIQEMKKEKLKMIRKFLGFLFKGAGEEG